MKEMVLERACVIVRGWDLGRADGATVVWRWNENRCHSFACCSHSISMLWNEPATTGAGLGAYAMRPAFDHDDENRRRARGAVCFYQFLCSGREVGGLATWFATVSCFTSSSFKRFGLVFTTSDGCRRCISYILNDQCMHFVWMEMLHMVRL